VHKGGEGVLRACTMLLLLLLLLLLGGFRKKLFLRSVVVVVGARRSALGLCCATPMVDSQGPAMKTFAAAPL
jgi:hypothetical protein